MNSFIRPLYLGLTLAFVNILSPGWFLKGQNSLRTPFPVHQIWKQRLDFVLYTFPFFLAWTHQLPESTDKGRQCLMEEQLLCFPSATKLKWIRLHLIRLFRPQTDYYGCNDWPIRRTLQAFHPSSFDTWLLFLQQHFPAEEAPRLSWDLSQLWVLGLEKMSDFYIIWLWGDMSTQRVLSSV